MRDIGQDAVFDFARLEGVGFAAKYEPFTVENQEYKAKKILTLIEAMDEVYSRTKCHASERAYDRLSEFARPNHLGLLGSDAV